MVPAKLLEEFQLERCSPEFVVQVLASVLLVAWGTNTFQETTASTSLRLLREEQRTVTDGYRLGTK